MLWSSLEGVINYLYLSCVTFIFYLASKGEKVTCNDMRLGISINHEKGIYIDNKTTSLLKLFYA